MCGTASSEWQAHSPPWSALLTSIFLSHLAPEILALPSARSLDWDCPLAHAAPREAVSYTQGPLSPSTVLHYVKPCH